MIMLSIVTICLGIRHWAWGIAKRQKAAMLEFFNFELICLPQCPMPQHNCYTYDWHINLIVVGIAAFPSAELKMLTT
jgi:hypothetical protein